MKTGPQYEERYLQEINRRQSYLGASLENLG